MFKKLFFLIAVILFVGCETPTQFSEKALDFEFVSLDDKNVKFKDILAQHKGKKVLIDIWASWCGDCIKGMPAVKKLQQEYKDVVFLFLSADREIPAWKNGIQRFNVVGEHYFMRGGMKKGDFQDFVNIDWIPRYMVVDEAGNIKLFKATKATDERITEALK